MNAQELFIIMKNICAVSLSLLLLLAMGTEGMVTFGRNRCMCRSMSDITIPLRHVVNFEVLPAGPSCDRLEYIVTLKPSGNQRCLDPTSKKVQKMYKQYLALQKSLRSPSMKRRPVRPQ